MLLSFHTFSFFNIAKSNIKQLESAWKSFVGGIIVNALNKDQGLIQIKWLEKVEHIERPQRYTHRLYVTLTDGVLYLVIIHLNSKTSGLGVPSHM